MIAPTRLGSSKQAVLGAARARDVVLTQATAVRMVAAWALVPAPRDPVRHLEVAHARTRSHLGRLLDHDAAREVPSVMTDELFSRLTDPRPAPLRAAAGVHRYTYTPRKTLRRVLDHALDHINQIDQWRAWRSAGVAPTPTDGWAPSTVTLPEDRLPLSRADLDAWLWRIDQAARLLAQRAAALTPAELDWMPPDGGWPLRRVFHHVARSELLYSASLDEALPDADPALRYEKACGRLDERVQAARDADDSIVYAGLYGALRAPAEIVDDVVTMEGELLAG